MRKILIFRNALIVLVVVIAICYAFFMRTKNTQNSKTNELFYQLINKELVTMNIGFEEKEKKGNIIFSTDKNNNKAIQIVEVFDDSEQAKENNTSHIKNISIIENEKTHTYQINYDLNTYMDFGENDNDSDITNWIENLNRVITNSKYYVKGYEKINKTKLYSETFKESGYVFYYDGNELRYIKQKDGFSGNENTLYTIKVEDSFVENSLLEIPNNFTLNN